MNKKLKDELPSIFPIALIKENEFKNNSEKNRYEKLTKLFLNLKTFIEKDEFNDKAYVKEVSNNQFTSVFHEKQDF